MQRFETLGVWSTSIHESHVFFIGASYPKKLYKANDDGEKKLAAVGVNVGADTAFHMCSWSS